MSSIVFVLILLWLKGDWRYSSNNNKIRFQMTLKDGAY